MTADIGNPTVAVALATYNGARFLPELLESLADQEVLPSELVVGDDASVDNSVEVLAQFAERRSIPVDVHVNRGNLGYAQNFIATFGRCRSDVVAFADQDDVWSQEKIAVVARAFAENDTAVLTCHFADVIDATGRRTGRRHPRTTMGSRYPAPDLPLDHFPGCLVAVRRATVAQALCLESEERLIAASLAALGHDGLVWLIAACVGESLVLTDSLVSYRQHDNLFGDGYVSRREWLRRTLATTEAAYRAQAGRWESLAGLADQWAAVWDQRERKEWAGHARCRSRGYRQRAAAARDRADLYGSTSHRQSLGIWRRRWRQARLELQPGGCPALARWKDLLVAVVGPFRFAGRRPQSRSSGSGV